MTHTHVLVELAYCKLCLGLYGPRVLLTIPKTCDAFVVIISVIYLPRIMWNLVSLRGTRDWLLQKTGVQIVSTGATWVYFIYICNWKALTF